MFGLKKKNIGIETPIFNNFINTRSKSTDPSGTVFACMNYKAKFISQLWDETLVNGESKDNWFNVLRESPNPTLNWEQIKFLMLWWAYQEGNGYTYAPKSESTGYPFGLYVLPSSSITVKATGDAIDYYEYQTGNQTIRIDPSEMIHFRRMFPSKSFKYTHLLGQPKELEECLKYMGLETSTLEFVQSYLDSNGVSPYILSATETMPVPELKKHKEGFNDTIGNIKYNVQAIVGSGMRVEPLSSSSTADGLAVKELDANNNRIARIWGLAMNLLDQDYGTQATASVMTKITYDTSLASDVRNFEQTITRFLHQYDKTMTYNIIDYEVEDKEEDRKQELHDFGLGLVTRNEIRARRGLEPVPNGDVYMIAGNYYPLDDLLYNPTEPEKKKDLIGN